ncbi:MAG: hypothetical protein ACI85Q_001623 [Salibacteraceae bacterium]|jgi:hypothetical protein
MKIARNILAVIVGVLIGSLVNMTIIVFSPDIIPLPVNINPSDRQSLVDNIHLFKPINFLMPFLAHAIGTMAGALIGGVIAGSHKIYSSLAIGFFFMLAGIRMGVDINAPLWFDIVDIAFAYIPMSYLGFIVALKIGGLENNFSPVME